MCKMLSEVIAYLSHTVASLMAALKQHKHVLCMCWVDGHPQIRTCFIKSMGRWRLCRKIMDMNFFILISSTCRTTPPPSPQYPLPLPIPYFFMHWQHTLCLPFQVIQEKFVWDVFWWHQRSHSYNLFVWTVSWMFIFIYIYLVLFHH